MAKLIDTHTPGIFPTFWGIFPAALYGCAVEYMPNCFEAYFIDELIGTFSSKVEAAAELLLHARRGSGKSPKLTSYVLCSRDAAFPSRRIIALVGYNNRNSQGLLRLAHLSADRNNAPFLSRCCYTTDIY